MYIYFICIYGKQKFVFLCRQTINGNRRLLCQQTCPSMHVIYVQFVHTVHTKLFYK